MISEAPDRAPLPDDPRVPREATSSALLAGDLPFDHSVSVSRGTTSGA